MRKETGDMVQETCELLILSYQGQFSQILKQFLKEVQGPNIGCPVSSPAKQKGGEWKCFECKSRTVWETCCVIGFYHCGGSVAAPDPSVTGYLLHLWPHNCHLSGALNSHSCMAGRQDGNLWHTLLQYKNSSAVNMTEVLPKIIYDQVPTCVNFRESQKSPKTQSIQMNTKRSIPFPKSFKEP